MFKKINNCLLVVLFLAVLALPLLFTRWESGGVSEEENRNLAQFPSLTEEGSFNLSFTKDFETWFMDHMGFRKIMIDANKELMQEIFDRSLTTSNVRVGKTGDYIYAPQAIVQDYAHINLRTEADVAKIGDSYQIISDYLTEKDILFYYVQCVDKHTVYPERFIANIRQIGNVSKTDQVLNYLEDQTTVNAIYFKYPMAENAEKHDVFSHWGDSTHWTDRGAYMSYRYMMDRLNQDMDAPLKVLEEDDYNITHKVNHGPDGQTEEVEIFTIQNPAAQTVDKAVLEDWSEDHRHSVWKNPAVENGKRLLLIGDSYINSYLIDDIAESFSEVWLVWGDYVLDLPELVELCDPDIVIYECAERVERSYAIRDLARKIERIG